MQPEIVILLLTKGRAPYTLRTIHAFEANFEYDNYSYYIADGGSTQEEMDEIVSLLEDYGIGYRFHSEESCAGINWNRGIKESYKTSDIYLRLENDWELVKKLDPEPYIELLEQKENVGCIRLGLLPINLDIQTYGFNGRIYQHILKMRQYTFSGNPCLVHRRFHYAYGYFAEKDISPGDTELSIDHSVRKMAGPEIWRPNELGDYGPFAHFGTEQSQY